jgi:hypothetical protein
VNVIEISKDLALGTLSVPRRDHALVLLAGADQANPLVAPLRAELLAAECIEQGPSRLAGIAAAAQARYFELVGTRWFRRAVAALFIVLAISLVVGAIALLVLGAAVLAGFVDVQTAISSLGPTGPSSLVQAGASVIGGIFVVIGIAALRRNRLRAYRWFEFSVLTALLLAQPFGLVEAGFAGLGEVFFDLALLVTLRYMISQEQQLAARGGGLPAAATLA